MFVKQMAIQVVNRGGHLATTSQEEIPKWENSDTSNQTARRFSVLGRSVGDQRTLSTKRKVSD